MKYEIIEFLKEKVKKQREFLKDKFNLKTKIILIGSVLVGITVCIFTGCFANHTEVQNISQKRVIKKDYSILVNEWNREAIKAELSDDYLLPRDNPEKVITKLNNLIQNTIDYKNFSEKYKCVLSKKKDYYLPIKEYANYLQDNQIKKDIIFNKNEDEDKIILELKHLFNSEFIDVNMIKRLAFLTDFKLYFNKNLNHFKKEGLPEKLQNYDEYMKFIKIFNKCKN
jgi:hypothetical protein